MSYVIKFKDNNFLVESSEEKIKLKYDSYYKELKDFLLEYNFIELTMEKGMRYFFLTTKFGLKLYDTNYFTKIIDKKQIERYELAKLVYIFYINKIL